MTDIDKLREALFDIEAECVEYNDPPPPEYACRHCKTDVNLFPDHKPDCPITILRAHIDRLEQEHHDKYDPLRHVHIDGDDEEPES